MSQKLSDTSSNSHVCVASGVQLGEQKVHSNLTAHYGAAQLEVASKINGRPRFGYLRPSGSVRGGRLGQQCKQSVAVAGCAQTLEFTRIPDQTRYSCERFQVIAAGMLGPE
jgi:hypothetical protein